MRVLIMLALAALSACAQIPVEPPKDVDFDARKVSREYSSFNARVLSEAGSVTQSFTASLDPQKAPLTRLESGYTWRLEETPAQVRVGDAVSSAGWSGAVRYGGMQFGTRQKRSDVVTFSEFAAAGLAVLPTVEDALFASIDEQTSLEHLKVGRSLTPSGRNAWSLKAKDAFGRSASIDAPLIAPMQFADAGCADFAVDAGRVRRDYAIESNEYGPTYAGAAVACGAPLGFTVEGRGEYLQDELAAFGFELARPLGALGAASAAVASSRADSGESGWLARFGFERRTEHISFAWRRHLQSREFRELGGVVREDPIMKRDLASVGVNVTDGAVLSLAYAAQTSWARERSDMFAIQQQLQLGRGSLAFSAAHSFEESFGAALQISYKRPLGVVRVNKSRSQVETFEPVLMP